eukprot:27980-Eustigmatos_ZCMA.PRE.1
MPRDEDVGANLRLGEKGRHCYFSHSEDRRVHLNGATAPVFREQLSGRLPNRACGVTQDVKR